eukprot:TRINITY_DN126_c0_g1_i1.p1 TRINITY_DN126_c0_g1~~TRINITY_DN126_c0_g1_i1.p1  ORF type:complete len:512 (-),score=114.02 TRINITY_DN126_c0_g1_i1:133-1668(-)
MKAPAPVTRPVTSSGLKQSLLQDFAPTVYNKYQRGVIDAKRDAKYRPTAHAPTAANNFYYFLRSNLDVRSSRYWSPPSLIPSQLNANPVTSSSVGVDSYFQQTDGDASFISSPFWFRLKNRKDFYTHDEFLSVLLTESYWEQQLAKIVSYPTQPLIKRKGWSNWTRISVKDKASASVSSTPATAAAATLSKAKKNTLFLLTEGESSDLVALRRPFRQRFFALFRAVTEDYNGDLLLEDWVKERVAELKVGLKLWLNPYSLIANGASVPNTAEALKALFPAGTLNRFGFIPNALQYLSYGGLHQSQFPLPYNINGNLHPHPNVVAALQYQHNLDLSNPGSVFHTHNSWQPVNERRVGNTSSGYQTDATYGVKQNAKETVKLPGFESNTRVESVNAIISSLWSYFLRRRFYSVRPSESDANLAFNESGIPIYRRRDEVPFGTIRLSLFKRRTWKQLYSSSSEANVSKIWALRPQTRGLELTEDLLSGAGGFHNYFTNVDKKVSDFGEVVVKGF